jgi:diacylglycerol kinase (ATP)
MRITVIYNPVAGGGAEEKLTRFLSALEAGGAQLRVYHTRGPGDGTRWLLEQEDQGDCVVAVGGDGTTNEVINGLHDGVGLGLFATGTANVLGRELGIPSNPEKAAEIILEGANLNVWPARLDGRRFVMMAGIGYDGWVVANLNLALKKKIGKAAYILAMLQQIPRYGSERFRLLIDGRPYDCLSAVLTNGRHYGGSFVISRRANIAKPGLQVLMFQKPGRWTLVKYLFSLLFARMENMNGVVSLTARRVEIQKPAGEPIQIDGDPAGTLPATVTVDEQPVAVRVGVVTARRLGNG